jgi:Fe-S-cluster containining protein
MTAISLKQFVPSEYCLQCKGCCRYKEADSAWRPKLGAGDQASLAELVLTGGVLDAQAYINTIQSCGEHLCRFLNGGDNTCSIYAKRPFECSLYPFILSKTTDAVKVYVHLSCPYVQDHLPHADFEDYKAYLKEFFRRADIREFLLNNKNMFHDYTPYAPELLHLFDLTFL